jgi:hypothetical protein
MRRIRGWKSAAFAPSRWDWRRVQRRVSMMQILDVGSPKLFISHSPFCDSQAQSGMLTDMQTDSLHARLKAQSDMQTLRNRPLLERGGPDPPMNLRSDTACKALNRFLPIK